MNITKFDIYRFIKTEKTESELVNSVKKFNHKKIELVNDGIIIYGKVFYDFVCDLNISEVKLTAKPKKNILIVVLTFLLVWTIGFIYQHGILFGLPSTLLFILFFGFVHKRMMELSLDELTQLIKQ